MEYKKIIRKIDDVGVVLINSKTVTDNETTTKDDDIIILLFQSTEDDCVHTQ
jgi:hypothetical protein